MSKYFLTNHTCYSRFLPKMRLTNKDPRTYVSPVGLPISHQKGLKIQARSAEVYNPQFPARDVVRRENYHRRQEQMANQGFRSVNYKPYEGIGDPFYLEEEQLILHALGQIDPVSSRKLAVEYYQMFHTKSAVEHDMQIQ